MMLQTQTVANNVNDTLPKIEKFHKQLLSNVRLRFVLDVHN